MNNKQQKTIRVFGLVCFLILCRVFLTQCAGTANLASPQASIPVPNAEDPITVSAPDEDGAVRIVASAGAVPNSAVVILEVGVTLSDEENISELSGGVLYRTDECTSDLPACPTLDENNKCQGAAAVDGSFSLQVPAELNDNILVSYLDPDNACLETSAFTVTVAEGVNRIDFEIVDGTNDNDGHMYFFGLAEGDIPSVVAYDPLTGATLDTLALSGMGIDLTGMERLESPNGDVYLVLLTSDGVRILPVSTDGTITSEQPFSVLDADGLEIEGGQYLGSKIFTVTAESGSTSNEDVFFYANQEFKVFQFETEPAESIFGYTDSSGNIVTRTMDLSFEVLDNSFSGYTDAVVSSMQFAGEYLVVLLNFSFEGENWTVALKRPYDESTDFQSPLMTFSQANTEMIILGTSTSDVTFEPINGLATVDSALNTNGFAVMKTAEQTLTFLDLTAETFICYDDEVFMLPGSSLTSDPNNDCDNPTFNTSADNLQPGFDVLGNNFSLRRLAVLFDSSDQAEIFMVGEENTGSGFITQHGTPSVFDPETSVSVMDPVFVEYLEEVNSLVIIDRGIANDDSSNIIVHELATTPSSY